MDFKYGLVSADSHAIMDRDTWTTRMSTAKWGDLVPQLVEVPDEKDGRLVHRWKVYGKVPKNDRGFNCPAALENNPLRNIYPKRWEDVPPRAYDPPERLEALDSDGIDAEVLFPERTFYQYGDADFELDAIRASNDALADWRAASERFVPLIQLPFLSGIEAMVGEVERSAAGGHRGVNMISEPRTVLEQKHLGDPHWYPLWDACQSLDLPINIHASGGLGPILSVPRWDGHTSHQAHAQYTTGTSFWPAQIIPTLIFSGIAERFPSLKFVFAEAGIGPVYYAIDACDHEWERGRLWEEGLKTRPSDIVRRQMYANFWFEIDGPAMRDRFSVDNIMWESDYPHIVSTYPESWKWVERSLGDVPKPDRSKMLFQNAARIYNL
jgi:predicted TIM-barrel fold metal-dependent hydrolase